MAVNRRLATALLRARMTQAALARALGVCPATVHLWLRGSTPRDATLHLVCAKLKSTPEDLGFTPPRPPAPPSDKASA